MDIDKDKKKIEGKESSPKISSKIEERYEEIIKNTRAVAVPKQKSNWKNSGLPRNHYYYPKV